MCWFLVVLVVFVVVFCFFCMIWSYIIIFSPPEHRKHHLNLKWGDLIFWFRNLSCMHFATFQHIYICITHCNFAMLYIKVCSVHCVEGKGGPWHMALWFYWRSHQLLLQCRAKTFNFAKSTLLVHFGRSSTLCQDVSIF